MENTKICRTFADINRRYTDIVNDYIQSGYDINTSTMSGSQGEIAKIDLTNGTEIVRILIDDETDYHNLASRYTEIIVGRVTDDIAPDDKNSPRTVWNNHLEVISEERFYQITESWSKTVYYGTKEEAEEAANLRRSRSDARYISNQEQDITEKAFTIAKRVITRKLGCTRIINNRVSIVHYGNKYAVRYNSKSIVLR